MGKDYIQSRILFCLAFFILREKTAVFEVHVIDFEQFKAYKVVGQIPFYIFSELYLWYSICIPSCLHLAAAYFYRSSIRD
jgi:hypothetical protein